MANVDGAGLIETIIEPRPHDLGGFGVRRVLPSAGHRSVGPFVFFDEAGPANFAPGEGIDVRPHPHIGLATVTYLFTGEILHRDSLGRVQAIRPGDVNWMTAGRGIVHSERSSPEARAAGGPLHGIQSWVALPEADEESEPEFHHHPADSLPVIARDGARLRLIAGTAYGETAPVRTFSEMFYLEADLAPGGSLELLEEHAERAVYLVEGAVALHGENFSAGRMIAFNPGTSITLEAKDGAKLMLLGGAALDGPRTVWWNFVSSDPARIEAAKRDWAEGRFAEVPGETEFIPLPEA